MKRLVLLAGSGSLAVLLGALAFQYLGGLAPCKMCIWQRWPHGLAAGLALLILLGAPRVLTLLGAVLVAVGAGIGAYHAGVELGVFAGPDSCTSNPIGDISADALLDQIMNAPLVRCDEVAWSLMGISMAGWNAILSLVLAALWLLAYRSSTASQ